MRNFTFVNSRTNDNSLAFSWECPLDINDLSENLMYGVRVNALYGAGASLEDWNEKTGLIDTKVTVNAEEHCVTYRAEVWAINSAGSGPIVRLGGKSLVYSNIMFSLYW